MAPDTPAARLRAARVAAGLTQAQLAGRLGWTQAYVGHLERGRKPLSLDRLHELATAIGCNPATLDDRLASRPRQKS